MSAGSLDAQSACGKDSSSRRQMDNEASGKEITSACMIKKPRKNRVL
jgi:hypothetical protein